MSNTTPATNEDALRTENEALKAQLAEIERIVGNYRGANAREAEALQSAIATLHADTVALKNEFARG